TEQIGIAHAVDHEPPVFHILALRENGRQPALYREFCNLSSLRCQDGGRYHEDCVRALLACGCECRLDILGTTYFQVLQLHPECIGRLVDLSSRVRGAGSVLTPDAGPPGVLGNGLPQYLQLFPTYLRGKSAQPCNVPAGSRKAGGEP